MKTAMYVCDTCGAVQFFGHHYAPEATVCNLVRRVPGDESLADAILQLPPHDVVCRGTVEYYAYSDFDRYK